MSTMTDAAKTSAALENAATEITPRSAVDTTPKAVTLQSPNWEILQMMSRANYAASTQHTAAKAILEAAKAANEPVPVNALLHILDDLAVSIAAQRSGVNLLNAKRRPGATPAIPVRRIPS